MAEELDKDTKRILGALSYPIFIVGIVAVAMAKKDKELRFHGFQGIFLAACMLVIGITMSILQTIFFAAPFLWWFGWIINTLFSLFALAVFVVAIIYAIKAYNGEMAKMPVVYNIAKIFVKDI